MKASDSIATAAELSSCFQCGQAIPENTWFARIKVGDRRVLFCKPRCVEAFLRAKSGSKLAGT